MPQGKGGGPKTPEGKLRALQNAFKHGFAARSPVIPFLEDEAAWDTHHKQLKDACSPEGYFEEVLVRRIAVALWEIDRLTAWQVGATIRNITNVEENMFMAANYMSGTDEILQPDRDELMLRQQRTLLPDDADLQTIMRHGNSLHRQWVQVYHLLIAHQARRRGERVPMSILNVVAPPPNLGPWSQSSSKAKDASPSPITELVETAEAKITQAERGLAERRRAARAEAL